LEIGWAYGVSIQSGRGNLHGILENIEYMEDSAEEEIQKHRAQLITLVQRLESKTVRLMIRTLSLLASNQDLISLTVYLPGVDGGDIWDLRNPNLYFADEIFSNSTQNVHTCIPHALSKMLGIKTLTIGYTKDIALAEKIARSTGAKELNIETCLEGHKLFLNEDEQAHWRSKGWRLEGKVARKRLLVDVGADEEDASLVKQEITSKLDEDNSKYQVAGRAKQEIKKRRIQR